MYLSRLKIPNYILPVFIVAIGAFMLCSCGEPAEVADVAESTSPDTYTMSIDFMTDKTGAPELQSFVQASNGSEWLLFGGRTNRTPYDGGLHKINGNNADYAVKSFPPKSFNENISVYDFDQDKVVASISIRGLGNVIRILGEQNKANDPELAKLIAAISDTIDQVATVFRNTNALATQDGDYLYVLGGYGTSIIDTTGTYLTFDHVAKIHVPSMINLVKQTLPIDWDNLIRVGVNETLKSTGGELHKIGETLYMCGGHNFGQGALNGQKYVDAVYPFTVQNTGGNSVGLNITVELPITDMPLDSLSKAYSDAHSIFRRRDGPIVPAIYKNAEGSYSQGITFYGGVFRPDSIAPDSQTWLLAWNNAIYLPTSGTGGYTYDTGYNQNNFNVYSCPDFEIFDTNADLVHTFLPGGIGNGEYQGDSALSFFSNSAVHTIMSTATTTLSSSVNAFLPNVFDSASVSVKNFYGAEAVFVPSSDAVIYKLNGTGAATGIIDGQATMPTSGTGVIVGYIYGGIVAYEASKGGPGEFGKHKSAATNSIWQVTMTRTSGQ